MDKVRTKDGIEFLILLDDDVGECNIFDFSFRDVLDKSMATKNTIINTDIIFWRSDRNEKIKVFKSRFQENEDLFLEVLCEVTTGFEDYTVFGRRNQMIRKPIKRESIPVEDQGFTDDLLEASKAYRKAIGID